MKNEAKKEETEKEKRFLICLSRRRISGFPHMGTLPASRAEAWNNTGYIKQGKEGFH